MKKSSGMNDYRWLLTCAAGGMLAAATPADAQIVRPGFLSQGQKSAPARTTPMTKSDDVNFKQQTATIQQPSQAAKIIPVGNNSIQEELEKLYRESGREMPAMTLESAAQQTSPNYQRPGQTPGSSVAAPAGSQPAPAAPATNWYAPGAAPASLPPSGTPAVPATAAPTAQPAPAPSGNAVSRFFKRLTPGRKETTPASTQPPVPPGVAQSYPAYQAPSVPPAELMTGDEAPLPSAAPNRLPAVIPPQIQAAPLAPTTRPVVTLQRPLPAPSTQTQAQVPAQAPPQAARVNPVPAPVPAPVAASSILAVPQGLSQTVVPPVMAPVDSYAIPPSPAPRQASVAAPVQVPAPVQPPATTQVPVTVQTPVTANPQVTVAKIPVVPAIPAVPAQPVPQIMVQTQPVQTPPVQTPPVQNAPVAAEPVFSMPVPLGTLPAPVEPTVQNPGRIPATPSAAQAVQQPVVTETRIPVNQAAIPVVKPAVEATSQAAPTGQPAVAGGLDDFPDPFTEVSEAMADRGLRRAEPAPQTAAAAPITSTTPLAAPAQAVPTQNATLSNALVPNAPVPNTPVLPVEKTPASPAPVASQVATPAAAPVTDEVADPFSGVALPPPSLPAAVTEKAPAVAPSTTTAKEAIKNVIPNKPGEPALEDWELEDLAEEAAELEEEARKAREAAKTPADPTDTATPNAQPAIPVAPVVPPAGQALDLPLDADKGGQPAAPAQAPVQPPALMVPAEVPALAIPPAAEAVPPAAIPAPAAPQATPQAKEVLPGTLATAVPAAPTTPAAPAHAAVAPAQLPADAQNDPRMKQIFAREGVSGLKGFCPVALRDQRELKDIQPQFAATYRGQKFQFSSAEAKARFEQEPTRYAPAAYGADVVVLANAKDVVEGSLDHAAWYKGKLYLFSDAESHRQFVIDPAKYASPAGLE